MMRHSSAVRDLVVVRAKTKDDEGNEDGGEELRFKGHAAVFRQPTLIGSKSWGFVEWIEKGAFAPVLDDDVRFLFNHDGMPLARTTNGTLKLSEDKVGLLAEAELAPVSLSRDLDVLIRRGDVTQMSFAFYPAEERSGKIDLSDEDADYPDGVEEFDGMPYFAVTKMRQLFDVSPVTYPAYEGTDATMLSKDVDARVRSFMEQFAQDNGFATKYSAEERNRKVRRYDLADLA